jgi:hypothetical protein
MVVLARLGGAEVAAIAAGVIFLAIMGYLLFAGTEKEQPKPPTKPRR